MHDLADPGISLPEGPYATVAGLALRRFGRIPAAGEAVQVDGWRIEVLGVQRRAITRLRLVPVQAVEPGRRPGQPTLGPTWTLVVLPLVCQAWAARRHGAR